MLNDRNNIAHPKDSQKSQKIFEGSPTLYLNLFLSVLNPHALRKEKRQNLQILMGLGKLCLYNESQGRPENFFCRERIAKFSKVANVATVSRFFNDPDDLFSVFGTVKGPTADRNCNTYALHDEVMEFMRLFKAKGLMRGMEENPSKWLKSFKRKIQKWFLPIAEQSVHISDFMNKLSTKRTRKSHAPLAGKSHTISPLGFIPPLDERRNPVYRPPPILDQFHEVAVTLRSRFQISEGDIEQFLRYNSLCVLKGAVRLRETYGGNLPVQSPVRYFQRCINDHKKKTRYNRQPEGTLTKNGEFVWSPRTQPRLHPRRN